MEMRLEGARAGCGTAEASRVRASGSTSAKCLWITKTPHNKKIMVIAEEPCRNLRQDFGNTSTL